MVGAGVGGFQESYRSTLLSSPTPPFLLQRVALTLENSLCVCVCVFSCAYDAYFMSSAQLIPAPADKGLNKAFAYSGDLVFGLRCTHVTRFVFKCACSHLKH